jgi:hypothetical protein
VMLNALVHHESLESASRRPAFTGDFRTRFTKRAA